MKVKDIFKDIRKGIVIGEDGDYTGRKYFALDTSHISNCVISPILSEIKSERGKMINDRHILQKDDIVISSVPSHSTWHVGYASSIPTEYIIVLKKNLFVLRDIIPEYNPAFVAEYLDTTGIQKIYLDGKTEGEYLQKQDIEEIDIPDIPLEMQNRIVELLKPINERDSYCRQLIENDNELKKYMLNKVMKNDK